MYILIGKNVEKILFIDSQTFELKEQLSISNYKHFNSIDISYDGVKIVLSSDNTLIFKNLLNQDEKSFKFQKKITKLKYLDQGIVIGDLSGKLHFVDNIESGKVKINKII